MTKFEHTVGSHSDDRGGESDRRCDCQDVINKSLNINIYVTRDIENEEILKQIAKKLGLIIGPQINSELETITLMACTYWNDDNATKTIIDEIDYSVKIELI